MNKTVVALYDNFPSANNAVKDLLDHGYPHKDLSMMSRDQTTEYAHQLEDGPANQLTEGTGVGAGMGAALGGISGLLAGVGSLFIPGVGPVLAVGPLVTLLTKPGLDVAEGGAMEGLLGALMELDILEDVAHSYAEGVRRGGTLVMLSTTVLQSNRACDILTRYDPIDVDQKASEWRQSGWSGFDPDQDADTSKNTDLHRSSPYEPDAYDEEVDQE